MKKEVTLLHFRLLSIYFGLTITLLVEANLIPVELLAGRR